jgi:hypothetical protein
LYETNCSGSAFFAAGTVFESSARIVRIPSIVGIGQSQIFGGGIAVGILQHLAVVVARIFF